MSPDYYDQRERAEPISRTILDDSDYEYVDDVPAAAAPVSNRRSSYSGSSGSSASTNSLGDCRAKNRQVPHEKYCDMYYDTTGCDDGISILRQCPNGLVFTGTGRHGLIGVCDYPHNVQCGDRERREFNPSFPFFFAPASFVMRRSAAHHRAGRSLSEQVERRLRRDLLRPLLGVRGRRQGALRLP